MGVVAFAAEIVAPAWRTDNTNVASAPTGGGGPDRRDQSPRAGLEFRRLPAQSAADTSVAVAAPSHLRAPTVADGGCTARWLLLQNNTSP
jgi:hypothetical protein